MKKCKNTKGITLIALIITIIVLLILAVVAIGAVQNDGIIEYAKNARNDYAKAQDKEQTALSNYLDKLKENISNEENEEVKQITIKAEKTTVEVRREITLEVYNQANQKVNSEDIEWTISWGWDEELGTVATVDNGVVKGKSVTVEGAYGDINVTVTAKYIPNNTIVATKTITVTPLYVGEGYLCPDCGLVSEEVTEITALEGDFFCNGDDWSGAVHTLALPEGAYDDGYITQDELNNAVCGNSECSATGAYAISGFQVTCFSCGYKSGGEAYEFYTDGYLYN